MVKTVRLLIIGIIFTAIIGITACTETADVAVSPANPFDLELSFPHGAPVLNQTKELKCTLISHSLPTDNLAIAIDLPEGIELIDGDLSQELGAMAVDSTKDYRIQIKPLQVGKYKIKVKYTFNAPGLGPETNTAQGEVYLSVSAIWSEWGKYPPWTKKGNVTPITPMPSE